MLAALALAAEATVWMSLSRGGDSPATHLNPSFGAGKVDFGKRDRANGMTIDMARAQRSEEDGFASRMLDNKVSLVLYVFHIRL